MVQTGGPFYQVELGRLDGKVATRAIVKHSLPGASFDLNQLNKLFAANGLTQTDMIALSGTHQRHAISRLLPSPILLVRLAHHFASFPIPIHCSSANFLLAEL